MNERQAEEQITEALIAEAYEDLRDFLRTDEASRLPHHVYQKLDRVCDNLRNGLGKQW